MLRSVTKKLEIEMFYGQAGYATLSAAAYTAPADDSKIVIPVGEWAPGIWAGSENMPIEVRTSAGVLKGTFQITAVDFPSKTLTLNGVLGAGSRAANDVIWHKGAYGKSFSGIHKILTQTTGSLFNISIDDYSLFKGNQYDAQSGALSFAKLQLAAAAAIEKGLEGKLTTFVNPRAWANMMTDQAALRKYDGSYSKSKLENGSEALTFYSQNGEIQIIPSIYIKEANSYLLSIEDWMRVGSTDVTFNRPGADGKFFRDMDNSMGYELRLYTDQALFCQAVGRNTAIINIVNQA